MSILPSSPLPLNLFCRLKKKIAKMDIMLTTATETTMATIKLVFFFEVDVGGRLLTVGLKSAKEIT